jgi:prepilin-type N-terminal cleavage/methylation domain-containing protein
MSKGFTLIELLIVVMIAAVIIGVVFMSFKGCGNDDIAFAMTTDKDIKLITNPITGETSECIRPFTFGEWKCRVIKTGVKKPAEKP